MPGGAPEGSKNAQKARLVYGALMRACAQEDGKRIREGAEKVLDLYAAGERWAVEFVRDTLDGKPVQSLEHTGEDGGPIQQSLKVEFVNPVSEET